MTEVHLGYHKVKEHHTKGFELINRALKMEESKKNGTAGRPYNVQEAISLYRGGLAEYEKGLAVVIRSTGGEESERALRLQTKMRANRDGIKERIRELEAQSDFKRPMSSQSFLKPGGSKPAAADPPKRSQSATRTDGSAKPKTTPRLSGNKDEMTGRVKTALKGVDPKLGGMILDQVVESDTGVSFSDVAGLDSSKQALREAVILPALRPELFTGLRSPVQGLLLFGPPGNGKTMLAKAVATEAKCVFFNISASALTSKWVGEAEKLVKTLFLIARSVQPCIIFIDEIDSILSERKESDNEVSRRLKTEFLVQFDGVGSGSGDRILVMGATNRPFDLDEAVMRRFPKRIFVGLPDADSRYGLLQQLLSSHESSLSQSELRQIASRTENYSFSDLTQLAKDAAFGPIRDVNPDRLESLSASALRPIRYGDFLSSLQRIRASANPDHMKKLAQFNETYGDLSTAAANDRQQQHFLR